jgi:hypothetical protein
VKRDREDVTDQHEDERVEHVEQHAGDEGRPSAFACEVAARDEDGRHGGREQGPEQPRADVPVAARQRGVDHLRDAEPDHEAPVTAEQSDEGVDQRHSRDPEEPVGTAAELGLEPEALGGGMGDGVDGVIGRYGLPSGVWGVRAMGAYGCPANHFHE